jgi:hypothetical protein
MEPAAQRQPPAPMHQQNFPEADCFGTIAMPVLRPEQSPIIAG